MNALLYTQSMIVFVVMDIVFWRFRCSFALYLSLLFVYKYKICTGQGSCTLFNMGASTFYERKTSKKLADANLYPLLDRICLCLFRESKHICSHTRNTKRIRMGQVASRADRKPFFLDIWHRAVDKRKYRWQDFQPRSDFWGAFCNCSCQPLFWSFRKLSGDDNTMVTQWIFSIHIVGTNY